MVAAGHDHVDVARVLVDAGVDPNAEDTKGETAITAAHESAMVRLLLSRGAAPEWGLFGDGGRQRVEAILAKDDAPGCNGARPAGEPAARLPDECAQPGDGEPAAREPVRPGTSFRNLRAVDVVLPDPEALALWEAVRDSFPS